MEDRIYAFLYFNQNLAYSGLELLGRFAGLFVPEREKGGGGGDVHYQN